MQVSLRNYLCREERYRVSSFRRNFRRNWFDAYFYWLLVCGFLLHMSKFFFFNGEIEREREGARKEAVERQMGCK